MQKLEKLTYCQNQIVNGIVDAILLCSRQIRDLMQNTIVNSLGSKNAFGDQQLQLDVLADQLIEKHMKETKHVTAILSEERPEYIHLGEGEYIVTYDPLDGSSIVDTNFAIGSIFAIWKKKESKLIGEKISDSLVNGILVVYGPRTTAILYNDINKAVQEYTLVQNKWVITESDIRIGDKAKIFAPGNLRAASQVPEYFAQVNKWIMDGMTLRYTGGLVPDVNQIFVKRQGIFMAVASKSHKCKLRVLYEVAPIMFLIEKAGGRAVARNFKEGTDYVIKGYEDKLEFAVGCSRDIEEVSKLLL